MRLLTSGWTSKHGRVACAYAAGVAACFAGLLEKGWAPLWVASAVLACVLLSLAFDAYAGLVVGLAGAAALIAVKRATGRWEDEAFLRSAVETVAIVVAAATAGWAGSGLRRPFTREDVLAGAGQRVEPVFGSLGLLPYDVALLRLEEEVKRAREHRRPLTVLVVDADLRGEDLGPDEREAALRAIARLFETRLLDRDVPFAVTPERLGAILPETTTAGGWERMGTIVDAVAEASFMSRAAGGRRPIADAVSLEAGIAQLGGESATAEGLLDRATAGHRRGVTEPAPAPGSEPS